MSDSRWHRATVAAVVVFLSAVTSCSDDVAPSSRSIVSDSSGIPIVSTAIGPNAAACSVSDEVLRIGAVDERSGSVL
jgi:hypothetical protein